MAVVLSLLTCWNLFSIRTDNLQGQIISLLSMTAKQLGYAYLEFGALPGWIVGLGLRLVLATPFGSHGRLDVIAPKCAVCCEMKC